MRNERAVISLESTGTIFGDHFEQDETYRLRRPQGMRDWLLVYTLHGEGYFRTPARRNAADPGNLDCCAPASLMNTGQYQGSAGTFSGSIILDFRKTGC